MKIQSPYVGLVPYEEKDREFFCGREDERTIVIANLMASRLTLFYGASGVGKSSVLNAGVVYDLKRQAERNLAELGTPEFAVVAFREWRDDPLASLNACIREAVAKAFKGRPLPPPCLSLTETLRLYTEQLEIELFIILDQFEEYFLYHGQEDGQQTFFSEFPRALNAAQLPVNFLISIREDALAKLDRFKASIPQLFSNYLRIDHLSYHAAKDAITEPIRKFQQLYGDRGQPTDIQPGLVEILREQVKIGQVVLGEKGQGVVEKDGAGGAAGGSEFRVEAPYLQLVMERLWNWEVEKKSPILRLETLTRELGGAENIVRSHLGDVMKNLPPEEQSVASAIFKYLVTPSRTKIAHKVPDLSRYAEEDNIPGYRLNQLDHLLENLSRYDTRILRAVPGPPEDPKQTRYEIFHDVLAEAILNWRTQYEAKQKQEEAETRAAEEATKRAEETERELKHTRALAAAQKQSATRLKIGFVIASLLLIVALIFWKRANESREIADQEKKNSQSSGLLANATLLLTQDADLSTLLAVESLKLNWTEPAETLLRRSLLEPHALLTLKASQGNSGFTHAAFSKDGQRLAAVNSDGQVVVWDAATGKESMTAKVSNQPLNSVGFSPDGQFVVLAGEDNLVRVRGVADGAETKSFSHRAPVNRAVFSPDGQRILTACDDGSAYVWEVAQGTSLHHLPHQKAVTCAAYSEAGKKIVTASKDKNTTIWNAATGAQEKSFDDSRNGGVVLTVAFSRDGNWIVTTHWPRTVRVRALNGSKEITFAEHNGPVTGAVFSPDGRFVISSCEDGKTRVWSVEGGSKAGELSGHTLSVTQAEFSPDGQRIVTAGRDAVVRVWPSPTGNRFKQFGNIGRIHNASFSADGKQVIASSAAGYGAVWDSQRTDQIPIQAAHSPNNPVKSVAISPDGKWLVTAGDDHFARVWPVSGENGSLAFGSPIKLSVPGVVGTHKQTVYQTRFSARGQFLLTVGDEGAVRVWDRSNWSQRSAVSHETQGKIKSAIFSPDEQKVVTADTKGWVMVWDVSSGKLLCKLPQQTAAVNVAAFANKDNRRIVTAGDDQTARVWNWETCQEEKRFGHEAEVRVAVFSPDDQRLLTAGAEEAARLWNLDTGQEVSKLPGSGNITSAAYSRDGKWIVTTNYSDKAARIWYAQTGEKLSELFFRDATPVDSAFSPDGNRILFTGNINSKQSALYLHDCVVCGDRNNLFTQAKESVRRTMTEDEKKKYRLQER